MAKRGSRFIVLPWVSFELDNDSLSLYAILLPRFLLEQCKDRQWLPAIVPHDPSIQEKGHPMETMNTKGLLDHKNQDSMP